MCGFDIGCMAMANNFNWGKKGYLLHTDSLQSVSYVFFFFFTIISYAAVVFDWYQLIDFLPVTSFLTSLFSDFSRCWHSTAV